MRVNPTTSPTSSSSIDISPDTAVRSHFSSTTRTSALLIKSKLLSNDGPIDGGSAQLMGESVWGPIARETGPIVY